MSDIIKVENFSKTYKIYKKEPGFVGSLKALVTRFMWRYALRFYSSASG